jgi:AcrR family transcriptional regulator
MSPAATMTPEASAQAVLAAADRLFYARGLALVTMADVRDAAGVSLRRLYSLYPSKRDLVEAWLEDRHVRWMDWFSAAVERRTRRGADALVATFDALREWATSPGYRGCAFLNSIAETSEIDDVHRAVVAAHKRALVAYLATLATRDHPGAPPWLPDALGVLIDGAIVQSAVFGTATPINASKRAAERLVRSEQ